jgi:hypothetical protein
MGFLLKMILFGLVIYYVFRTVGGFIFKLLGGQARQDQPTPRSKYKREGEINIDYMPENHKRRTSSQGKKGGDYIDYEEVK